ncbi:DUF1365 domain-containing protein [Pseudomonas sp. BN515]|uniref:DUF1365 domain-containing protein n=1 Tax=Pseudomonas sp. BN515 TaxID=2567892 RepID=UPI0024540102|nr:DUF1365 domain-containing protein [Pseudomonas sp. BN515]MDH4872721.1 DUF1365 domain-containing protein [Pseudomonas sp. BN515]
MNSGLYGGWVSHRRLAPYPHGFRYPIGMLYLDLAEQQQVLSISRLLRPRRLAPLCWRESDYLPAWTRTGVPLAEAVRALLHDALGEAPRGAIHLLTQPRSWGLSFNPVSFYFCHDDIGRLAVIVCEVRNTPWRERHHYVLPVKPGEAHEFRIAKAFHVSPFLPLEMDYRMRFLATGPQLHVHMENWRDGEKLFEARLSLQRQTLDAAGLRRHVLAFPWMSLRTLTSIYWQALRLLLKGTPLHDHQASEHHLSVGQTATEDSTHVRSDSER